MKRKTSLKIVVDIGMTVMLLFLMTYERIGEAAHEWLGIGIFVLFIIHHILNRKWSRCVFKGKYTLFRIWQTVLVAGILLAMAGSMYSGVILFRTRIVISANQRRTGFCQRDSHDFRLLGICTDVASLWTALGYDDGDSKGFCKRTSYCRKMVASWDCRSCCRVWRVCFHTAGNRKVYAFDKSFCIF